MSANGANFITYLNAIMNSATHSVLEDMTNKDFFPDGENPTVVFAAALRRIKVNDWIDVLCFILVLVIFCIAPDMEKYFN